MIRMRVRTEEVFVRQYVVSCPGNPRLAAELNRIKGDVTPSVADIDLDRFLAETIREYAPGSLILEDDGAGALRYTWNSKVDY